MTYLESLLLARYNARYFWLSPEDEVLFHAALQFTQATWKLFWVLAPGVVQVKELSVPNQKHRLSQTKVFPYKWPRLMGLVYHCFNALTSASNILSWLDWPIRY